MEREKRDSKVETLEAELRKESYRYQLALKDGAVTSIVRDVIQRITFLEEELKERRSQNKAALRP
ncbi:MAG TPA: hypothetical protein VJT83_05000 [Chitinophagaceae bacterium]|nr:hypothetical protein [Chitinophagaceae bacterium]